MLFGENKCVKREFDLGGDCEFLAVFGKYSSSFDYRENHGNVQGEEFVGGIVGKSQTRLNSSVSIKNCLNTGEVTGQLVSVAGILGHFSTQDGGTCVVANCVNVGLVTGVESAGGIVGVVESEEASSYYKTELNMLNCFSGGEILCEGQAHGLVGKFDIEMNDENFYWGECDSKFGQRVENPLDMSITIESEEISSLVEALNFIAQRSEYTWKADSIGLPVLVK